MISKNKYGIWIQHVFVIILMISSVSQTAIGQSFKERLSLGVQFAFSNPALPQSLSYIETPFFKNKEYGYDFELGLISALKVSKRINFTGGIEYRFQQAANARSRHTERPFNQPDEPRITDYWLITYRSNSVSPSVGFNYKIIKSFDFDIIVLFVLNPYFTFASNRIIDYKVTRRSYEGVEDDTYEVIPDYTKLPYLDSGNYYLKMDFGIGVNFKKFQYEVSLTGTDESLGKRRGIMGLTMRYLLIE